MADDGLLAVGGVGLLAVIALAVSLLRDGGDRVINIPEGFGQSDDSGVDDTVTSGDLSSGEPEDGIPDDLPEPGDNDWQYEDEENNPDSPEYEDPDLDFGDDDPEPPEPSVYPDSLTAFDPAGRVELINDGETVGL